jgi:hypothetical protein
MTIRASFARFAVALFTAILPTGQSAVAADADDGNEAMFTPTLISRTATIVLNGPLEEVFPLFGPIEEMKWAEHWRPEIVFPKTGPVQEHMVFRTRSSTAHGGAQSTWVVSVYSPDQAFIEYTVLSEQRLWWIAIQCAHHDSGERTAATITYSYLGMTEHAHAINRDALQRMFADDLNDWGRAINHYLATGELLRSGARHHHEGSHRTTSSSDPHERGGQ